MKITALVENTSCNPDILTEHGLSLYIETSGHRILFDMGQSALFAENAEKLGIDLTKVDLAVLSHGHYDHGGGLETFLSLNAFAPVYVSSSAFGPHYHGTARYIGLDTALKNHPRLILTEETAEPDQGITIYHCNDRIRKYSTDSAGLSVMQADQMLPDAFLHEQYLLLEEERKKILISGCSHKGILNITDWFRPDILIGGFHYSKYPTDETLAEAAKQLDSFPTVFYTCHCTGSKQYDYMAQFMQHLHYLSAGQTICL